MIFPATTAFFTAILALVFMALTMWVVAGRLGKQTLFGDGGDNAMMRRIRAHANFIEYVPLALILIGLFEADGGSPALVRVLLVLLVVSRLLHPVGMLAPANSPRQFACRGGGIVMTIGITIVAAIALLVKVA